MGSDRSITATKDFERVLRVGRRARGQIVSLTAATAGRPSPRLGLAVRVSDGKAVTRNRARRRIRAAFWSLSPVGGCDVVIRSDQRAASVDFSALVNDIARALAEAGVEVGGPR